MRKLLISLLILTPLLAGCANVETCLTLNKDKSVQVVSSLTYKGNLSDSSDKTADLIMDVYPEFLNDDYNVTSAFGSKFSTITGTKKVDNIFKNDIDLKSLGLKTKLENGRFIDVKKNFLVTSYNIDAEFDYPAIVSKFSKEHEEKVAEKNVAMTPEYLHKYGDMSEMPPEDQGRVDFAANMDDSAKELFLKDKVDDDKPINPQKNDDEDFVMSFSIEIPAFAYYSNADSTDGNMYTWNIKKHVPTEIRLQYVKYSSFAVFSIIFIGIMLLVYLAYRILRHDARKRVGTNN